MNAPDLIGLLPLLVIEAPMILLPVVGLILARSKLLPRGTASLLAALGFALLLAHTVSQLAFQLFVMRNTTQDVIGTLTIWGTAQRIVLLAGLICLSSSIFAGRTRIES